MGHLVDLQDVVEWEEDEDEYVRKNLPSELVGFRVVTIQTYVDMWFIFELRRMNIY